MFRISTDLAMKNLCNSTFTTNASRPTQTEVYQMLHEGSSSQHQGPASFCLSRINDRHLSSFFADSFALLID
jgi:hypothetical protein